jgi:Sulfotransferase domain
MKTSSPTPTTLKISFLFTFALLCLRKQWIMVDEPSLSRNASSTNTRKNNADAVVEDPLGVLRQPANNVPAPTKTVEERTLTIDSTPSERNVAAPVIVAAVGSTVTDSTENSGPIVSNHVGAQPANNVPAPTKTEEERALTIDSTPSERNVTAPVVVAAVGSTGSDSGFENIPIVTRSVGSPAVEQQEHDEPTVAQEESEGGIIDASNITIKVQYPVFVASLYKSGTTTIHAYFECGRQKSVHYSAGRQRTGPCLQRRIQKGLYPVFQGCGGDTFDIYTDNANLNAPRSCFDPSVHGLDAIYESYPNATILMAIRDSQKWLDSVDRYRFRKWALLEDLMKCPDLWTTQQQDVGNRTLTRDDILQFYDWHTEHVRSFAAAHPSMTYIEVQLESDDTAKLLEDRIGIPAQCWGHSNINTRHESREVAPS